MNKKRYTLRCEYCNRNFQAARPDAKYCAENHKQAAYRDRRDAKQVSVASSQQQIKHKPMPILGWSAVIAMRQVPQAKDHERDW
jgi:hypothetical protein